MTGLRRRIAPWIAILVFFGLWKIYVMASGISPFLLPPPEDMIASAVHLLGEASTWHHIWVTFAECIGGFLGSLAIAAARSAC